jgi:hypothetical protein
VTLATHVYVLTEADAAAVFHECRSLLGCTAAHTWTEHQEHDDDARHSKPDGYWTVANDPSQGLPAWLLVNFRQERTPLRTPEQAAAHAEWCGLDCDGSGHQVACYLDVDFDTAYSYQDEYGGCGDLHARLVAQLGQWLDARGIEWSWKNKFTGEVHGGADRYERLLDLSSAESAAREWLLGTVLPAIIRSREVGR